MSINSVIIAAPGYQDQEVLYPYYRLQEEGKVTLVAQHLGKIKGILGTEIESNAVTADLEIFHYNCDLLVLPGGVKAMEKLRLDDNVLAFIGAWASGGRPIASICSGAQLLISARVHLLGRRLAAYPAMAVDVVNAGAVFVNEPVVTDGNIVSSPHYKYMAEWMKATIEFVKTNP